MAMGARRPRLGAGLTGHRWVLKGGSKVEAKFALCLQARPTQCCSRNLWMRPNAATPPPCPLTQLLPRGHHIAQVAQRGEVKRDVEAVAAQG